MAIEQQPLPGAPAGSGWTSYFYLKDEPSSSAAYGDLTTGWRLLPTATHVHPFLVHHYSNVVHVSDWLDDRTIILPYLVWTRSGTHS